MKTVAVFSLCCALATSSAPALNPDAPEIVSVAIAPDPVDISTSSQTLTVTLQITDEEDGFSDGTVRLYNPSGNVVRSSSFTGSARVDGDAMDGTYAVLATVPRYATPGDWRIDVTLRDTSSHEQNYIHATDFPVPADSIFTVVNNVVDGLPPQIGTFEAVPQALPPGSTVTLRVQVTDSGIGGVSGFAYGFPYFFDAQEQLHTDLLIPFDQSLRISGDESDGVYEIPVVIPEDAPPGLWHLDFYFVDAAGNAGFQTAGDIVVSAGGTEPSSLGNAVDAVQYPWSTGEPAWTYQTDQAAVSHDGVDVARSGPTPDNGESTMDAHFTGPGTLTFWWRTDSQENFDCLSVEDFDSAEYRVISGDSGWIQETIVLDEGPHHLRWTYAKSPTDAVGQDCGWVDEVRFVADSSDLEPPTLQTLEITPDPVDIATGSQEMTFTIVATDDFNGIVGGNLRVFDPFEGEFISLSFDETSRTAGDFRGGTFTLHVTMPQGSAPGTWRVEVDLFEGNSSTVSVYRPGVLAFPNPGEEFFEVSDGTSIDTVAPLVTMASINPDEVDITTGESTVTVTLHITDAGSGFSEGDISVYIDENRWTGGTLFTAANRIPGSGDEHDAIYEIEVPVVAFGPDGTWRIAVSVVDASGNRRGYDPFDPDPDIELPGEDQFEVINGGQVDAETPELTSIDIAPVAVDITDSAKTITITVAIEEDLSGLRDANLTFRNPSGQPDGSFTRELNSSNRISGDALTGTGTYEVPLTIPQGTQSGEWEVQVFLRDRTGRAVRYGTGWEPYLQSGDGRFSVSTGTGGGSTYENFITLYGLSGDDALATADPDNDGFNNATELLLGTNPTSAASNGFGVLTVTRDATHLHLNFTIDATMEVAADGDFLELGDGTPPFRVTGQVKSDPAGTWSNVLPVQVSGQTYRVSVPFASAPMGYVRLLFEEG
jgi:hypothetical protein